jgi:hypothetical protein
MGNSNQLLTKINEVAHASVQNPNANEEQINQFIEFCKSKLGLANVPLIKFVSRTSDGTAFACYVIDNGEAHIELQVKDRHIMDIFRSLAHELVHHKQNEDEREMNGGDGSTIEDEANATAAVIMRQYSNED